MDIFQILLDIVEINYEIFIRILYYFLNRKFNKIMDRE